MDISSINNIQFKNQVIEKAIGFSGDKPKVKPATTQVPAINIKNNQEELRQNIEEMLKFFESNSSVRFQYDKSINRIIIQVLNGSNKEVIKQIPPESMVRFLKAFNDFIGLLVDKEI
ncbi:MAG TPA: flagellar protein FlaG [Syntrophorhabdaceae bacterium]|nr:flagellar protein FlaG [Syntrophorhabdaceae bacterium]HQK47410.1 flagellar protein FlaG [Syntrophorhabdaceae bacterium]